MTTTIMYFNCTTLRATMKVSACEENRKRSPGHKHAIASCRDCKDWQKLTTDSANLLTIEQALRPAQESVAQPLPKRFDIRADITRVHNNISRRGK